MQARVVMHPDFGNAAAGQLQLSNQFDTDRAAGGGELDIFHELTADEAEVTIDIADSNAKDRTGKRVVDVADPDAMSRIVALQLIAVDESDVRSKGGEELRQFANIVLSIAVRIEHQILGGRGKSAAERASVTTILRVRDDAQAIAELLLKFEEHFARIVLAAIVDNDDFEVPASGLKDLKRLRDESR